MQTGQQLGPFTIEKELGAGAMGMVYRGVYNKTGQRVAIKLMLPGAVENKQALERFKREIFILKQLNHPNIVRLLYVDKEEPPRYYAMEYIQGETLDRVLARRGRYSWEEVVTLGQQLCSALQHAHDKGVVHRDLKPSNLMVLADGTLKLTDFGIAKDLDVTQLTEANCTVGTASYMSPEQCRGERNLTHKSDLYSLGIVLYELLTGKKPFVADNVMDMFMLHVKGTCERPSRIIVETPKWLDILICQLMEKKPEQRPRDAATAGQALIDVMDKVEARQSAGVETAQKGKADAEDKATARTLLGEKKKKKKKPEKLPLLARAWVKALGLLLALASVVLAGWLVLKPPNEEALYRSIEKRMTSTNPDVWKAAYYKDIPDYIRRFGNDDNDKTRQVRAWRDQVSILQAEKQLAKTVEASRKIDESKMDDLSEAERKALRAARAEDEGDLPRAETLWKQVIRDHPNQGNWEILAQNRVNVQLKGVQSQLDRLRTVPFTRLEEYPDDPLPPMDESEQKAFMALRFEKVGDLFEAQRRWEAMKDDLNKKPDQRTWFLLAASRSRELKSKLPRGDETKWRVEQVTQQLNEAEQLRAASNLFKAQAAAQHVVALYADAIEKDLQQLHGEAVKLLERIKKERGVKPQ